ncbi:MAG: hypothetical protein AUG49_11310 [Catenulispora sp. 13_1_20CM_3_70_7]|nr:MAG: hypothetical protein AUG49_11310 [Catenulispora sp. 13_1_20CM_3_70_7]
MKTGDLDVRASFNLSYRNGGSPGDQRAFRLLGLIGAADFAAWIIGPLLGVGPDEAEAVGMRLESAQLIETVAESPSGELRYRFHDLLRALAREHLADDEDYEQQRGAVERFARACAELAAYALDLYEPSAPESVGQSGAAIADTREGEAVRAHPTRWFADEVSNLVDAVVLAERFELWDLTWQICRALIPLLEVSSLWVEWAQVNELGLKAARQAGDGHAEAVMLRWRGELHRYQGDHDGAIHDLRRCIGIFRQRNESANQAGALIRLGEMRRYLGETAAGLDCMTKAKHIYLDQGHELGVAYALTRIGGIHRVVGQINDAIAEFLEALPILLEHGHRREAAIVLISLGDVYHLKAQWTDAMGCFERCGELFHSLGDAMWEANTARHIGVVDTILGRRADARRRFDEALKVFRLIGDDRKQALTLWNLGELLADENRLDEAMSAFESARRIFERIRNPFNVTTVLISIAWAQARYGDLDEAESWVRRSLAAAESHGTDVLLATAQLNVAQLYVRSGRCSQGRAIAQASLDVHRRMGSLRWEPAALEIIAESVRLQEHS